MEAHPDAGHPHDHHPHSDGRRRRCGGCPGPDLALRHATTDTLPRAHPLLPHPHPSAPLLCIFNNLYPSSEDDTRAPTWPAHLASLYVLTMRRLPFGCCLHDANVAPTAVGQAKNISPGCMHRYARSVPFPAEQGRMSHAMLTHRTNQTNCVPLQQAVQRSPMSSRCSSTTTSALACTSATPSLQHPHKDERRGARAILRAGAKGLILLLVLLGGNTLV